MADGGAHASLTAVLSAKASRLQFSDIPIDAAEVAKQALLDWIGVTVAAQKEPLVEILVELTAEEGGRADCTVIARKKKASLSQAVLINGSMGHALDYDDVIVTMGHPTVPVAPVVFALAERHGLTGKDVLTAYIAGVELETRVSKFLGPSHYAKGWHSTATNGTFGAAAAAGRLLGLDPVQMGQAFGIAGTQAAGLKSAFGTMCKPLHAGKAAVNGMLAAQLAAKGFTSNANILEAEQGYGAVMSEGTCAQACLETPPGGFWVRSILFKRHAACYMTHSAITAAINLRDQRGVRPDAVTAIRIGVDPGHLNVCAIPQPRTGLECKFSLAMAVALALAGENTADDRLYTDEVANRPDLVALRSKVVVDPRKKDKRDLSDVTIELADGQVLRAEVNVAVPAEDVEQQWAFIETKALGLMTPIIGGERAETVVSLVKALDQQKSIDPLLALIA
jgi:2-methylcitrate dehydratase PrpD